ncbi:MAG: guanylate kinase [bacterium]
MNSFIFIISGVSGSGKGTLWRFLKDQPEQFANVVSYTTRAKRDYEIDGRDYHFVSLDQFELAVENNEFIEWENVHQYKYGRKKADFEVALNSGKIPVLELDVKGMITFRRLFPGRVVSIFVTPPTIEETIRRLRLRGTETEAEIELRRQRYDLEHSFQDQYDYILINDDLERAKEEMLSIIEKEKRNHAEQ